MRFEELTEIIRGETRGYPSSEVSGFVIDSRRAYPGSVFFALKGETHDGHDFVYDAFARGAVGAVVDRSVEPPSDRFVVRVDSSLGALKRLALYKRDRFRGDVVGVAGSVGKTTTKELIYHLLSHVEPTYRSEGNLNSQIGLPLVLANMPEGMSFAVLELGASAVGDVKRLMEFARPRVRVITALGEEHLQSFGSLEGVIRGNGEILEEFTEESRAVIPHYALAYYKLPRERVTTFGAGGDLSVEWVRLTLEGTEFGFWGERFVAPVLSSGVVDNVLASFGVLTSLGYDPRDFVQVLSEFKPPRGRMNLLRIRDSLLIDDTYNANPPSVRNALFTLSGLNYGFRKVAVLGDMLELGEESGKLHAEVGKLAAELNIDICIFHGNEMKEAYKECLKRGGKAIFCDKKEDILDEMLKYMQGKNIILLKGSRGMEMEQIIDRLGELFKDEL
ncbi:UDP-N-acetylmuramoyl-tripeptide--D-alanyl-D-alanine ligase [Hydrogenivirga sp.]